MPGRDELGEMRRVGSRDHQFGWHGSERKSLPGDYDIDVESLGVRTRSSLLPGLRPKLGCQSQRSIGERKVAPRRRVDECVKPGGTESLPRPQQFALELVIDDGRHDDTPSAEDPAGKPVSYRDNLGAALRMSEKTEGPGVEEKELSHG